MNQQQNQNPHDEEWRTIRRESEFLKQVTDFARYMQTEHIVCEDGKTPRCRSLLIAAADGELSQDNQLAMGHISIGRHDVSVHTLASMMSQPDMRPLFDQARAQALDSDTSEADVRKTRSRLRTSYGFAGLVAFWILFQVAFQIAFWPVANLFNTISSLLLSAFCLWLVIRDLLPLRRRLARQKRELSATRRREAAREVEQQFSQMLQRIAREMREDDDDDDD